MNYKILVTQSILDALIMLQGMLGPNAVTFPNLSFCFMCHGYSLNMVLRPLVLGKHPGPQ